MGFRVEGSPMMPIDISFFFATERNEAFTKAATSNTISVIGIP